MDSPSVLSGGPIHWLHNRAQPQVKRTKPLKRTALRKGRSKRSRKSKGQLFPKLVDEQYRSWIRRQPCLLIGRVPWEVRIAPMPGDFAHGCWGIVQPAHVRNRGAAGPDHGNIVPLCAGAHDEQGRAKKTFEARWGVDLEAEAIKLFGRYKREQVSGYVTEEE